MIILDNGHSGLVNGVYTTPGKRSPDFGKGIYYEGVGNRDIVKRIFEKLCEENILCHLLVPENEDISLLERVKRANKLHKKYKNAVLISVHSDAASNPNASGFSVWTTKGETKSDNIATIIHEEMVKVFPDKKARKETSDRDVDFEADFYILRKTTCPAVLTENFFMTNKYDYELLMSEEGREKIAIAHVNAIKRIINI